MQKEVPSTTINTRGPKFIRNDTNIIHKFTVVTAVLDNRIPGAPRVPKKITLKKELRECTKLSQSFPNFSGS